MDHYTLKERIGNGSYSEVFSAVNTLTQAYCALKIMKHPYEIAQQNQQMEVAVLKRFSNNPTIIRLIETFIDDGHLILVFELLDSSLIDYYKQIKSKTGKPLTEAEIRTIVYQVCLALQSMHEQGYAHRDVKPENILIRRNEENKIVSKVVDFGLTKQLDLSKNTSYIATRWYRSPQLLLNMPYDVGVDIFALGCLIVQLYLGFQAFPGSDATDQLNKIFAILGTPTAQTWPEGLSAIDQKRIVFPSYEAVSLAANIPNIRPEGVNLLEKMLVSNPKKRIRIDEVLKHPYFDGIEQQLPKEVLTYLKRDAQTDGQKAQREITKQKSQEVIKIVEQSVPISAPIQQRLQSPSIYPIIPKIHLRESKFETNPIESQILVQQEPEKADLKDCDRSSQLKNHSQTIDSILASAMNTQRNSVSIGLSNISTYRINYSLTERGMLSNRSMIPPSDRSPIEPKQNQQKKAEPNKTHYPVSANASPMTCRPNLFRAVAPRQTVRQQHVFSFSNNIHMRSPPVMPSPPMKKLDTIMQKVPKYLPNRDPKYVSSQPTSVDSKKELNYAMINNILKPQIRKDRTQKVEKPETLHIITNKARPVMHMLSPMNVASPTDKTVKKQPQEQKQDKTERRLGGQKKKKKLQLTTNSVRPVIRKEPVQDNFCCGNFWNNQREEITIEPKRNKLCSQ